MSAEAGASLEPGKGETGGRAGSPHTLILLSLRVESPGRRRSLCHYHPTPGRRYCPHRFPPSRLFSSVKGVSGSQFSHNFSPGLQLLTRGASPPTPSPPIPAGAAPPVFPAPTRETAGINFPRRRCGKQTPRSPRAPEPVDFGWIGGGGHRRSDRRRFCCQTPSPLRPQRHARCPGQTSRPRKQGWRAGGTQHPLNCKAKQCTWAAEAPEASCTPTSNKARSWVPPTLRAEICPPPAPTHARSQSLLPQATRYRSRRGPGHFAARRPHRAGPQWPPPLILETRSPGTLPSREMQDGLQRDREPLIGRRPP